MEAKVLRTPYQIKKEAIEIAIYKEYNELITQPRAMSGAVDAYLMEKYNIGARSTIRAIRIRIAEKLKETK